MARTRHLLLATLMGFVLAWPAARLGRAEGDVGGEIAFFEKLQIVYAEAKSQDKPVMICINSRRVDGGRVEPAARELRENTYRDPTVVAESRKFVCGFLTAESSADDFGELRLRYGIDGDIVSPQHIFAYPDGSLMFRKEYWPHGHGEASVRALLDLMQKAFSQDQTRRGLPPPAEGEPPPPVPGGLPDPVPAEPEARQAWVETQLGLARSPDSEVRRTALRALVEADQNGDVVARLLSLLEEQKQDVSVLVDVVRALGRPGLEAAREAIEDLLDHKDDVLRANAAVSLEYVGSKKSVSALNRQAAKEKDEGIANHLYRALGRCGVDDGRVRQTLLKRVLGAKSHFGSYGPIIGLAYFDKDPKTAREVEKLLKKEGIPGGRRGGWRGGGKRALLTWCLAQIGDQKSAKFLREEMIPMVPENEWTAPIVSFYRSAADACEGREGAAEEVLQGVRFALGRGGDEQTLNDEARQDREGTGFTPLGEDLSGRGG